MSKTLAERIANGKRQHGEKFDATELEGAHPSIRDAYASGLRVRVTDVHGFTRTGVVSTTTGWRPAFILMHRSNDTGSWDVLGANDYVVATWRGRKYEDGTPYGYTYPAPGQASARPLAPGIHTPDAGN